MLSDKNISVLLSYYDNCIKDKGYNFTLYLLVNKSISCRYYACYDESYWDELIFLTAVIYDYFLHYNK